MPNRAHRTSVWPAMASDIWRANVRNWLSHRWTLFPNSARNGRRFSPVFANRSPVRFISFTRSLNWVERLERFKPNETDIGNREKILEQLRRQFQKDCPDCHLSAFGSFYNGFGFRQSDLDVCFVFKDQREQKVGLEHRRLSRLVERCCFRTRKLFAFWRNFFNRCARRTSSTMSNRFFMLKSRSFDLDIAIFISTSTSAFTTLW